MWILLAGILAVILLAYVTNYTRKAHIREITTAQNQSSDPNIFMLCERANESAFAELPEGFHIRKCRLDELELWKRMPFDDEKTAEQYLGFIDKFFDTVYAPKGNLFYEKCLFAAEQQNDIPIATCFAWKSYDKITTLAWYKVKKEYEGRGIGRALLTEVMRSLSPQDYPVLLHTQPESYRAIKLYSDFGFKILTDEKVGKRDNHISKCLSNLKDVLPAADFNNLQFTTATKELLDFLAEQELYEF